MQQWLVHGSYVHASVAGDTVAEHEVTLFAEHRVAWDVGCQSITNCLQVISSAITCCPLFDVWSKLTTVSLSLPFPSLPHSEGDPI